MAKHRNIIVFTSNLGYSARKGIVNIDQAIPGLSWLILVHTPHRTPGQLLKSQWRNIRVNGLRWIPYQAEDLRRRIKTRQTAALAPHDPGIEFTLSAMQARPNMRILRVPDIHGQTTLETARDFAPELGLSIAAPILRRALFSIPALGTLNLHKGKLPDYRGMPPAFWELWHNETSIGCTVHWVDDKLDTGDIVRQTSVERAPFSTLRGLQLHLDEVGVELMCDAAKAVLTGTSTRLPQGAHGKTYRKPTLAQFASLERKLSRLQPDSVALPLRVAKRLRSEVGLGCSRLGLQQVLEPRITVLLYHRVSDDVRDNLTVGIGQFDRQMALIREHCTPLSIRQVLESRHIPKSSRPLVSVTFDDGYLDNYMYAAPILMRHGIPAAFFVSTGIVAVQGRFPHDVLRGNAPIPLMTWDQLRRMRDSGFTIGSHTVNHVDCAAEPEETVREELRLSREHLQQQLGPGDCLFAYPYGGRQHMTPQRLELVRQEGYAGCLSAYGGTNIGAIDRFNVLRRGIHWEFSDHAFLFECLGLR